jgi:hypothetical protein
MAKLTHRCSALELQHLIEAIYPEERRHLFTDRPWQGEGSALAQPESDLY